MDFVAIDLETANCDMASICQIGVVRYKGGVIVDEWSKLIDPEDWFDDVNISIHGITDRHVAGKPKLPEVAKLIRQYLEGSISVCHTHFDRVSLGKAFEKYDLPPINTQWLDSARVARRAWTECAYSGYGLANLSEMLGFEFEHHDALEDARAAGTILLAAINETGLEVSQWLKRVEKPIFTHEGSGSASPSVKRTGDPIGALSGESVVFTGALSIPRQVAADIAASVGCNVGVGVSKKTTILVVGDQDIGCLAGHEKSSKHRKAEELIKSGQKIRILGESDFVKLVESADK